jgi:hypothetical protein
MGSFERFKTKTHFNSLKRLVGITALAALAALAVKLLTVALATAAGGGTPLDLLARVPASLADLGAALLVFEVLRTRRPLQLAARSAILVAVSPVLFVASGLHGDRVGVAVALLLLTMYLLVDRDAPLVAGITLAIASRVEPMVLLAAGPGRRSRMVHFGGALVGALLAAWVPTLAWDWDSLAAAPSGVAGPGGLGPGWVLARSVDQGLAGWLAGVGRPLVLAAAVLPAVVWVPGPPCCGPRPGGGRGCPGTAASTRRRSRPARWPGWAWSPGWCSGPGWCSAGGRSRSRRGPSTPLRTPGPTPTPPRRASPRAPPGGLSTCRTSTRGPRMPGPPLCAGGSGSASPARRTVLKVLKPGMELLLFRLGDRGYASPRERVREVIDVGAGQPVVPGLSASSLGGSAAASARSPWSASGSPSDCPTGGPRAASWSWPPAPDRSASWSTRWSRCCATTPRPACPRPPGRAGT